MEKSPKIFMILGRAGSGKGTQADFLVKEFALKHIGSGDLLRARANLKDFTGKKIWAILEKGDLAPTSLIFLLWALELERIKTTERDDFKGIVFDGSPRELDEALLMQEALRWYEWDKNIKVLLISLSRQESFERLTKRRICEKCGQIIPFFGDYKTLKECDKCGGKLIVRGDDSEAAINKRLDLFEKEVVPVVEYYRNKGLLIEIDGSNSIREVRQEILEKLK